MTDPEEKQKCMRKNLFPEGKKSALKKSQYTPVYQTIKKMKTNKEESNDRKDPIA